MYIINCPFLYFSWRKSQEVSLEAWGAILRVYLLHVEGQQLLRCSVAHQGCGPPHCSSVLPALLGLDAGRRCRQEVPDEREVVVFISSKYMDVLSMRVKILDICIAKWVLASLCEGWLKFSLCNPISSLQLGPRGITPKTYVAFPPLLLFLQNVHQNPGCTC